MDMLLVGLSPSRNRLWKYDLLLFIHLRNTHTAQYHFCSVRDLIKPMSMHILLTSEET